MEWQAVVLAIQILLLAAGWLLFQRARGELSAHAAETPVLAEVKALQHRVKRLLADLESATDRQAERLENGCADAVAVLTEIENKILIVEELFSRSELAAQRAVELRPGEDRNLAEANGGHSRNCEPQDVVVDSRLLTGMPQGNPDGAANPSIATDDGRENKSRDDEIYALADRGHTAAAIAYEMRLSEGEVEIMLGLRGRR